MAVFEGLILAIMMWEWLGLVIFLAVIGAFLGLFQLFVVYAEGPVMRQIYLK